MRRAAPAHLRHAQDHRGRGAGRHRLRLRRRRPAHQQDHDRYGGRGGDGGWGEDLRSYRDAAWIGRGASTPSQTAWALLALLAAGERSPAVEGGVRWLVERQRPDGTWDEPYFTGTGFPGDFYINYHLYRLVFPISALGRYLSREGAPLPGLRSAGSEATRATREGNGAQRPSRLREAETISREPS
ncbi:hypothetical protein [Nonomuraea sp. NPDC049784]|uniref:hypothetical protein n=1 Tax=Nonomuraea sp. NPDC049784 TaxID=3154361 RepID=UPI0033C2C5A2